MDGFVKLGAAGIVAVMKPTGTVVAVVCAEALGAAIAARERATTAAMERVQMEEGFIALIRWLFMWLFAKECKLKNDKLSFI